MTHGMAITCDRRDCSVVLFVDTNRWLTLQLTAERQGWHITSDTFGDLCPAHAPAWDPPVYSDPMWEPEKRIG